MIQKKCCSFKYAHLKLGNNETQSIVTLMQCTTAWVNTSCANIMLRTLSGFLTESMCNWNLIVSESIRLISSLRNCNEGNTKIYLIRILKGVWGKISPNRSKKKINWREHPDFSDNTIGSRPVRTTLRFWGPIFKLTWSKSPFHVPLAYTHPSVWQKIAQSES